MNKSRKGPLSKQRLTYKLEVDGKFYIIENVPARVDEETGEQFFAPSTVERLQEIILSQREPGKMIEMSVYRYNEQQKSERAIRKNANEQS